MHQRAGVRRGHERAMPSTEVRAGPGRQRVRAAHRPRGTSTVTDRRRQRALDRWFGGLARQVRSYHELVDAMIVPALAGRGALDQRSLDTLAADHAWIDQLLGDLGDALGVLSFGLGTEAWWLAKATDLAAALDHVLRGQLAREQRLFGPLVRALVRRRRARRAAPRGAARRGRRRPAGADRAAGGGRSVRPAAPSGHRGRLIRPDRRRRHYRVAADGGPHALRTRLQAAARRAAACRSPTSASSPRRTTPPRPPTDLGFPVVAKLNGDAIAHKTERGLVRLGLGDADAVRRAAQPSCSPPRRRPTARVACWSRRWCAATAS